MTATRCFLFTILQKLQILVTDVRTFILFIYEEQFGLFPYHKSTFLLLRDH